MVRIESIYSFISIIYFYLQITEIRKVVCNYPDMSFIFKESVSDVVFLVNGHRVPAIKRLIIVKSPVFAAMFSGKFIESKLTEIVIKDTTVEAFKTMIRFIYDECIQRVFKDNDTRGNIEHIWDVYQLSDRYDVLRLRQSIGQHLTSIINLKNLLSISTIVFNYYNEVLIASVMAFIEKNINEVIKWDINELQELNDATNDNLLHVLNSDLLRYNLGLSLIRVRINRENKCIWMKNEALDKYSLESRPYLSLIVEHYVNDF